MTVANPLEGKLIRLRAREPGDEVAVHAWLNDPDVLEYLDTTYPPSHALVREHLENAKSPGYSGARFAVVTKDDGRLIGQASLRDASPENRAAELGITIGEREFWNRGYGTDAVRTLCRFGFEMMNLHRIVLHYLAGNDGGRTAYERVGFRAEGVMRQDVYKLGRYHDVVVMGLLEGELKEGPA